MDEASLTASGSEEVPRTRTPLPETLLFFFAAVGCTVSWTAVLSQLVFYTQSLGPGSYLWLNVAVYFPMLPVSVLQTFFDDQFDRKYQSRISFTFRGTVGYTLTAVCTALLPLASDSLLFLASLSLLLGSASAVLHGMLKQLATLLYPDCGRLTAAVTAGMQASALFVLIASASSSSAQDKLFMIWWFYSEIVVLVLACWLCFLGTVWKSPGISSQLVERDSMLLQTPLLPGTNEQAPLFVSPQVPADLNQWDNAVVPRLSFARLCRVSWTVLLSISFTVGSSMMVASWFNRVPTTRLAYLPDLLFYTRLFADLLGRPATLLWTPSSRWGLLAMATLRIFLVPLFFWYVAHPSSWTRAIDVLAVVLVGVFAVSSGFLATVSYQMAPTLLSDEERAANSQVQTSLINVSFGAAVVVGLAASFAMKLVLRM